MNARASSSPDWVTLKPGENLWEAVPKKRTLRIVRSMTGRLLAGRYRLGEVLDNGTLYATYSAYDVETKEQVAIDLLTRPEGAAAPTSVPLRREARRIVDTKHANLRVARTVGVDGGAPFIVTGEVTGESLSKRLARGPLSVMEAVSIALQVIGAIGAAHAAGLAHGNLKPEKIRITSGPTGAPIATVMGLGVATLFGTMRGVDTRNLGTPPYLAPEQLTEARDADELSDVWGIGLLLYEMLTARRAFDGATADEVAKKITKAGTIRMRQFRSEIPVPLERIVGATLARSREQRLSLRDVRRALVDLQEECASAVRPAPRLPSTPDVIVKLSEPCDDDIDATTDLYVHVETDLGSL